ncbi:hypothetical protein F8S13_03775 [Chloroflexia bacterium SDU3-3]|nr:hypothetical protein F8S13_03775 [Chloroflexia bacterium SDU3-3]
MREIDSALGEAPITVLATPPGWGKTTALVNWSHQGSEANTSFCWISLEEADHDPFVFLSSLIGELRPHHPQLQALHDQLQAQLPQQHQHSALRPLIHQLIGQLGPQQHPLIFIFDNFRHIATATPPQIQAICSLLLLLVQHVKQLRIVILSRTVMPFMVNLQIQGYLRILNTDVLAFTPDEIIELGQARYMLHIDTAIAQRMADWSRGWPVALVLALEDWKRSSGRANLENILERVGHTQVVTFLREHVFNTLPAPLQAFLIDIAALNRFSAARCDQLRAQQDSAQLISEIEHHNLFIDIQHDFHTFHPLFGQFLIGMLKRSGEHGEALLRRAAVCYQQWGECAYAFATLLLLQDIERLHELVICIAPDMRREGRQTQLIQWIMQLRAMAPLPVAIILLQIRLAIEIVDWNTAYMFIQQAMVSGNPDLIVEATLYEVLIACLKREARAQSLLQAIDLAALPAHLLGLYYELAGRVALIQHDRAGAIAHLKQAISQHSINSTRREPITLAHLYDLLGLVFAEAGNLADSAYYLDQAQATWNLLRYPHRRIITLNNSAWVAIEKGNMADARRYLELAYELAECHMYVRGRLLVLNTFADLALIEADLVQAHERYRKAAGYAAQQNMPHEHSYAIAGALRCAALLGDQHSIELWQAQLSALPHGQASPHQYTQQIAQAIASPDPHDQLAIAQAIGVDATTARHDKAQLLLLQALAAYQLSGWEAAKNYWAQLERAAPVAHLHPLLAIQCQRARGLLAAAAPSPLASKILGQLTGSPAIAHSQADSPPLPAIPVRAEAASGKQAAPVWRFSALGSCALAHNHQQVPLAPRPLDLLVMMRLLEAGAAGIAALRLWEDVWGDQDYSSDALRQSLSRLRRSTMLPIRLHQGHCQLTLDWNLVDYDVWRLEEPLTYHQIEGLQEKIALYHGSFLSHIHHESRWLNQRRIALHRRVLALREALALIKEKTHPHEAFQIYSQVLEEDGMREVATAGAMRCSAQLGDRKHAISIYQKFCSRLIEELGADPSPWLVQLYQEIAG